MKKQEKLKEEIKELIDKGAELGAYLNFDEQTKSCPQLANFIGQYEIWYTKSLMIMKRLSPERTQDFALLYDNPKRKEVNLSTYCISDALRGISELLGKYGPWTAMLCVIRQTAMLQACLDNLDSTVLNIQTILQADIFDSEIESAKHLLKNGFLRAAGVVCGVVIEKHYLLFTKRGKIYCKPHSVKFRGRLFYSRDLGCGTPLRSRSTAQADRRKHDGDGNSSVITTKKLP